MKVLQVNCVYPSGSTGKLTRELHHGLTARGESSLVAYGRGYTCDDDGTVRLCPDVYGKANGLLVRMTGLPYGGCAISTRRLIKLIESEHPDIVHLQCINGHFVNIYKLVAWLNEHQIKTVVTLHAEFMFTANCSHSYDCYQWVDGCHACPNYRAATKAFFRNRTSESWQRMRDAFQGFGDNCKVVAVSGWLEERARHSGILGNLDIRTIENGVDASTFCISGRLAEDDAGIAAKYGLSGKTLALHVTAHFTDDSQHAKGGWYVLQLAQRMPEVTFVVAGRSDVKDAPSNVVLLGEIHDQCELAALYRLARLTVVTSRRETYSMPCAESLCCGTPVVGFEAGAPETIAIPEFSEFVAYGDVDALESCIRAWLDKAVDQVGIADKAWQRYSSKKMVASYMSLYEEFLCE